MQCARTQLGTLSQLSNDLLVGKNGRRCVALLLRRFPQIDQGLRTNCRISHFVGNASPAFEGHPVVLKSLLFTGKRHGCRGGDRKKCRVVTDDLFKTCRTVYTGVLARRLNPPLCSALNIVPFPGQLLQRGTRDVCHRVKVSHECKHLAETISGARLVLIWHIITSCYYGKDRGGALPVAKRVGSLSLGERRSRDNRGLVCKSFLNGSDFPQTFFRKCSLRFLADHQLAAQSFKHLQALDLDKRYTREK